MGNSGITRREMLRGAGALAGLLVTGAPRPARSQSAPAGGLGGSRVALVQGESRAGNILEALRRIEPEIRLSLARKKRVLIKPNLVTTVNPLSVTNADCLRGLLEFFAPLTREEILIAESAGSGPTPESFDRYGYTGLPKEYRVRLVDLDTGPAVTERVVDQHFRPKSTRISKLLLDHETYIVSAAPLKTHDRAVVTLSLKNLAVGAMLKDPTFRWWPGSRGSSDKPLVHGGPANEGIHFNLFALARQLQPDLAVLDGYEGMEGNGPLFGTGVPHRVAIASTDWLAADRTGAELMGFEFRKIGYLVYAARAGLGEADPAQIEVLGPPIRQLARHYRPHDNIEQQYRWLKE